MHVPQFEPKQGVQIETDPKATSVSSAAALGDDEGVIDSLIKRLEVGLMHLSTSLSQSSAKLTFNSGPGPVSHIEEQL